MAEQAKGKVYSRQQLEIVKIHDERTYAGGMKSLLPVTAKNLSLPHDDPLYDKPIKYTVFKDDLREYLRALQPGARFFADIEEKPRTDSEYGPDRNIVQVYDDSGKPVSVRKSGGGYAKSPEVVRMECESAEAIAAFNGLLNIYTSVVKAEISFSSGTSNTFDKAIRIAFAWGISRLEGALPAKLTAPPPGVPPQKPGESPKSESTKPASKETKTLEDLQAMEFKNPGEYKNACMTYFHMKPSQIDAESAGFDLSVPAQRHMAWLNIVENYGVKPPA